MQSPPIELAATPFFPQQKYQCGPAALAEILTASGVSATPVQLVPYVYIPAREGSLQPEMLAQIRSHGRLAYQLPGAASGLLAEVKGGRPVLVLQNLGLSWLPQWHYAVVIGYEPASGNVILRSGTRRREVEYGSVFENTWSRSGHWAVIALAPGELPVSPDPQPYVEAVSDYEAAGATKGVVAAYRAGVARWPDNLPLGLGLGNALYRASRLEDAEAAFRRILVHNSSAAVAMNNLAMVLADEGKWDEALHQAHKAVALGGAFEEEFKDSLRQIEQKARVAREKGQSPRPLL